MMVGREALELTPFSVETFSFSAFVSTDSILHQVESRKKLHKDVRDE